MDEPPVSLLPIEVKALVRYRDSYRCVECGITSQQHIKQYGRNLDVHRVVPGSVYTVSGCQTLCRKCHKSKPKSRRGSRRRSRMMVPALIYWKLAEAAARERCTINKLVVVAVEEFLAKRGYWPLADSA